MKKSWDFSLASIRHSSPPAKDSEVFPTLKFYRLKSNQPSFLLALSTLGNLFALSGYQ